MNRLSLLFLLVLVSCGRKESEIKTTSHKKIEKLQVSEATDGVYHAHLRPVNPQANGYIPHGGATLRIEGDLLTIKTYLDDDSAVPHRQNIHVGTRCPTNADDLNGDGFVDYHEAMKVVGKVLIPLDDEISTQKNGAGIYPLGSGFTYTRSGSISEILNDLWKKDLNPKDEYQKLPRGEGMKLVGRVVLIHGTYSSQLLPTTLAARGKEPANLSLPIGCGIIAPVP